MYTMDTFKQIYASTNVTDWSKLNQVMTIIQTVQEKKDTALFDYSEKFDNVTLTDLEIKTSDLELAYQSIDDDLRDSL